MININFDQMVNPIFLCTRSNISQAYLLHRAVEHYGSANVEVVGLFNQYASKSNQALREGLRLNDNVIKDLTFGDLLYNKQQKINPLIDHLNLKIKWQTLPPTNIDPSSVEFITQQCFIDCIKNVIRAYAPEIGDEFIEQHDVFDSGKIKKEFTALYIAGLVDADLNVVPIDQVQKRTLVVDSCADDDIDMYLLLKLVSQANASINNLLYIPFNDYTLADIAKDASHNQDMLETILIANDCRLGTSNARCGYCKGCMSHREALMEAEVTDTATYDMDSYNK